jgi:hypothetical protein
VVAGIKRCKKDAYLSSKIAKYRCEKIRQKRDDISQGALQELN